MSEVFWFVGASYNGEGDQTSRFIENGIWENGYDDRYLDQVRSMQPGERIAIKSSYTKKKNLPFNANGRAVSVMEIKATGTITENLNDGQRVKVQWDEKSESRYWYFFTNRTTIWCVKRSDWYAKGLIDFTFSGVPQEIDKFRNAPYWKDRYGDLAPSNQFAWIPFYEAFARKLLDYRNNREYLTQALSELAAKHPLLEYLTKDQNPAEHPIALKDICPFTFMGSFNRGKVKTESRTEIAGDLAGVIGLDIAPPTTFEGIPLLNPQNSWFFSYSFQRQPGDIEKLWDVFEAAINLVDDENELSRKAFIDAYNHAIQVRHTSWNLTQALFWILPWDFLALDSQSRNYIESKLEIQILTSGDREPCGAERYLELIELFGNIFTDRQHGIYDFPSLSLAARHFGNNNSQRDSESFIDNRAGQLIEGNMSKNVIFYGPPGTGKTYTLMQLLKKDYESVTTSLTPEEWRNQVIAEKFALLKWWEAVAAALYDLGGKASVPEIEKHPFIRAVCVAKNRSEGIKQTLWGTLQHHTVDTSTTVKSKLRFNPAIFDKTADSVWHFAGDWKDACVDLIALVDQLNVGQKSSSSVQRYSFVTFHQSYGYEEFVEGLRPVLYSDEAEVSSLEYEIRPGVFKELCRKARLAPEQRFAMVIDEINRGNISKIFGELITLIEPDKRDPLNGSKPPIELTLAYSGEKFSVPANVDIIGTMNTADRSLALLDTALRRRFDFIPLMPDTSAEAIKGIATSAPLRGLVVTTESGVIDVRLMLERINSRIEALYDRDHCIGHAYFTALKEAEDGEVRFERLKHIFQNRIIPLLEEYFFEDWHKIRLVLGDNQKPESCQFITELDVHEQDLNALFGADHGLDTYATNRRYSVQVSAFELPEAYLGIYQLLR